jgi:hypothetical protein
MIIFKIELQLTAKSQYKLTFLQFFKQDLFKSKIRKKSMNN